MDSLSQKARRFSSTRKGRRNLCLISFFLALLALVLVLVILGLTVFKPKHTATTINSITVKGLSVSLNVPRLRVDLNVTLELELSLKNPNRVGFRYNNGTALLYYKGGVVGEAPIVAGNISPGETIGLNETLTVLADRLLSNSDVYSDVINGALPLSTYTRISGTVVVLRAFKHRLVSYTWCDVTIEVASRAVRDSKCRYKTEL